jgi:hypothetical protein
MANLRHALLVNAPARTQQPIASLLRDTACGTRPDVENQ